MEDWAYDISLTWEGEAIPEGWVYNQKGWTVFLQEGETVTELTPDGFGHFFGPVEPGQTFYFSRVMEKKLDTSTLRLGRANRTSLRSFLTAPCSIPTARSWRAAAYLDDLIGENEKSALWFRAEMKCWM